jgi:putative phosphoesterase
MKVAILSDIHGNNYALEAIIKEMEKEQVEKILILGDIVGYYYNPDIVLQQLNAWDFEIIKGNHEDILMQLVNNTIDKETLKNKYGSAHFHALEKLSEIQINWLVNLEEKKYIEIDDCKILMCHGSSWDSNYYIYPNSDKSILEKCDSDKANYVFIGHSHYPFVFKNKNSLLINCGSVGQARNQGAQSNWCLLDSKNGAIQVRSTKYNTEKLKSEILTFDPSNSYLTEILNRNLL